MEQNIENIVISNKKYNFITNYRHDAALRKSLNILVEKTFGFNFESWYQSGYWGDGCLLYTLFDGEKAVSHITVNLMDFIVLGEKKLFIQLGTVMTDTEYKKQGLSRFLLEKILNDWQDKCDMIYLYANDSVLDFYPKFGFIAVNEYEAVKKNVQISKKYFVRKMDINNQADCDLLYISAQNAKPLFKISADNISDTVMFYCKCLSDFMASSDFSMKDNLYYIEELKAVVVAEYQENNLIVYDIFTAENLKIDDVLEVMATDKSTTAVMKFMPAKSQSYEINLYKDEDNTLFVMADKKELFGENKLIFPILSHT